MNVIIFSKDRAAQLDLLLRSMPIEQMQNAQILYDYSDTTFEAGYDLLISYGIETLYRQADFKANLIDMICPEFRFTVFFTDDDVFINDPQHFGLLKLRMLPGLACLSLRLNPRMEYCYTLNRKQTPPKMHPGNVWNWRLADADYGYPMSLDGHIFRTSDILPLLEKLDYHDPNSLEAALARNPINRPMMMCFDNSVIVNNPINRVQDTIKNRHGNVSAEWLNEQFLAGRRIKLEPFIGIEPNACHVELPIEWE